MLIVVSIWMDSPSDAGFDFCSLRGNCGQIAASWVLFIVGFFGAIIVGTIAVTRCLLDLRRRH